MKKLIALTVAVLVAIPAVAIANGTLEGEAELDSIGGSGITGEFEFEDDGSTLTIEGEAEGLDPSKIYVSLIYDNGSVAVDTELLDACEPSMENPIEDTMFVGFWEVDSDGDGTLTATNFSAGPGAPTFYVPLELFHTISIREFQGFDPITGEPIAPVRACGIEETDDDDGDDGDDD